MPSMSGFFSSRTSDVQRGLRRLAGMLDDADAVVIGAGAGLSTAAGLTYSGERFERCFGDFAERYGITDMYSGGFYPFPTPEITWAWWARHIFYNRYVDPPGLTYQRLRALVDGRDHFVITTNVDHCFQKAGFEKDRLFYTQGDYGLWQCSLPCHQETYDNEAQVRRMVAEERDMAIPSELVPVCPRCGRPMSMNLRADSTFVEDAGWHAAAKRYADYLDAHATSRVLYLELGVGANTPVIIKYPFWQLTARNPRASYACVNLGEAFCPQEIAERSVCIDADINDVLDALGA